MTSKRLLCIAAVAIAALLAYSAPPALAVDWPGIAYGGSNTSDPSINGPQDSIDLNDWSAYIETSDPGKIYGSYAPDGMGGWTFTPGYLAVGSNLNSWNGVPGILSTSAATSGGMSALGYMTGAEYVAQTGLPTFWGQAVVPGSSLIMYTWGGDANFSGTADIDDYNLIDGQWYTTVGAFDPTNTWRTGDFNYSGTVDIDDYNIIDGVWFAQVGAPFPGFPPTAPAGTLGGAAVLGASSGSSAVPEPSAVVLLVAGLGMLLLWKRKHA